MASVALLFPGTGAQQVRMGAGLYRREPAFTEASDERLDAMGPAGYTLRQDWLDRHPAASIDHVTRSTPLLFAVGLFLIGDRRLLFTDTFEVYAECVRETQATYSQETVR